MTLCLTWKRWIKREIGFFFGKRCEIAFPGVDLGCSTRYDATVLAGARGGVDVFVDGGMGDEEVEDEATGAGAER